MASATDPAFRDKKRKPKPVRESKIEGHGGEVVEAKGGLSLKWVSPGMNGVPDRIKLFPIPPEHRQLVARYLFFVEYKAEGQPAEPHQIIVHELLQSLGFKVLVIDSKQGVNDAFRSY